MDHVTVEGNDSLFMFHGKMTTFATIGCEDVEFKDFAVDFQVPTVIDMTVESVEGNTATIYIPECYNYEVSGTTITWYSDVSLIQVSVTGVSPTCQTIIPSEDTVKGIKYGAGNGNAALKNVSSIQDLGNHRVKITYSSKASEVQNGMCFQSRPTVRDHAGTFFWKSKDITMTSLDIHFLHGFGMVGQHSENITMDDVDFEAPKEVEERQPDMQILYKCRDAKARSILATVRLQVRMMTRSIFTEHLIRLQRSALTEERSQYSITIMRQQVSRTSLKGTRSSS